MLCAWKTTPMLRRTSAGSRATSCPMISARPPEGTISVERMRKVVVLPLPLGPSRPKISAGRTSNDTPARAHAVAVLMPQILKLNDGGCTRDQPEFTGVLASTSGSCHA